MVPEVGRRRGPTGGHVLHPDPVLRAPAQLLHPHLALRLDEFRPLPASVVHESGSHVASVPPRRPTNRFKNASTHKVF